MKLYDSFKLKNLNLKNRFVMPPMCMYMAKDGFVNDFHYAHYQARAIGGVGLIIVEATGIQPNGRITYGDLGIWDDKYVSGLKRLVDVIHENGAQAGIQLNHAGRKSKTDDVVGPSKIKYADQYDTPRELNKKEIKEVINSFKEGARRANEAGFDLLEIHAAHGYLLFQFMSPISNKRNDEYKNRTLLLSEVIKAVKEVWPKDKVLAVRITADEYVEEGLRPNDLVAIINELKHLGIDLVDVSSGGNILTKIPLYPGYQLPFSKIIKNETNLPTMGGGLINSLELANFAVNSNHVDLVYIGRLLLREPYFVINNAPSDIEFPEPYRRGRKR